jgi:hypothetical protein
MQPHPVSEVKPWESISWVLKRTVRVIGWLVPSLSGVGIGVKLDRYVIHIFDSMSETNASGQPWAVTSSEVLVPVSGSSRSIQPMHISDRFHPHGPAPL